MAFTEINLSELNGENGFVINGVDNNDNAGYSVSNAGDVNGDGFEDLIIGAPSAGSGAYFGYEGRTYVVFGSDEGFDASFELADLDGNNGFVLNGINNYDNSGRSVSNAGDINGDDISDLIIGAPYAGNGGESYVVFGSDENFDANFELADLDGSNGFTVNGIEGNLGRSVSNAGDINGDGISDLIIGAPYAGNGGESYVVFGSNEGFDASLNVADLDGSNGFTINGLEGNFGRSVSNGGDINGDSISDLIIGAPYAGPGGESYVVFGSDEGFDASFELTDLNGSNGFTINGLEGNLGRSVSNGGDINGDSLDDLIIGAPYAGPAGESYVVFGSNEGFDASLNVADLDGNNGFVITGIDNGDNLGRSVSGAEDINGDGLDELIIGAPNADLSSNYSSEGQAYVIFGSSGGFGPTLDLGAFDGSGLLITGIDNFDNLGNSVSGAGDLNGDGADDLIIGAPYADANGNFDTGQSYVVFGVVPLELIGTEDDDILTGANGDDFIDGLGGDDILQGLGGNDQILGGSGEDLIAAGDGNDTVEGGTGNDNISGNGGNDNITGDDGRDDILGGEGNDLLDGGSEADRILGEAGDDSINGGSGQDSLLGGQGNDLIEGGSETDLIFGDSGDDSLNGDDGRDTVEGGVGQDSVAGGLGDDLLLGNSGDDSLSGEDGTDTLRGGFDNDSLDGGAGNDELIGVELTDPESEFGAGEIDTLTGGASSDTFVLGDETRVYYEDGDPLTAGESDFAAIADFDERQDFIQLNGSAELYSLDFFTSELGTTDAALIYDPGVTARGELIATLQDVSTDLSVADPSFTFV